jgi:hypothetical protein
LSAVTTGRRVRVPSARRDRTRRESVATGELDRRLVGEQIGGEFRQRGERGEFLGGQRARAGADAFDEHEQREQLRRVRLRRRDRSLVPRGHVDVQLGGAGQRRLGVVRHRERDRAALPRRAHDLDQIGRAAALAHADDERFGQVGPGAVDGHGRGRGEGRRDAQTDLGEVRGIERGVIGRTSSGEHHVAGALLGDGGRDRGDRRRVRRFQQLGIDVGLLGDVGGHAGTSDHILLTHCRLLIIPHRYRADFARTMRSLARFCVKSQRGAHCHITTRASHGS